MKDVNPIFLDSRLRGSDGKTERVDGLVCIILPPVINWTFLESPFPAFQKGLGRSKMTNLCPVTVYTFLDSPLEKKER
jgi:hypothetical protein